MNKFSKKEAISFIKMMIEANIRDQKTFMRHFKVTQDDPYIIKRQWECNKLYAELDGTIDLIVDNINVFE